MAFPKDFIWGAAAAAYQVEGAAGEDGRGLSVWDMFCRIPGRVWEGNTGDVASDHYHHLQEDVDLMKEIGLHAYRFSIAWPRIMPEGAGTVNLKGLGFYDRLVDALLAANIVPFVTLFHWDYPHELYCKGGWLNPDSPNWFTDYTRVVVERLSDRVTHWMTLNEPQCFIGLGLQTGLHAPGDKLGLAELLRASHHTLLAHGKAVQVIRAFAKTAPVIGFAPASSVFMPATESTHDIDAARFRTFDSSTGPVMTNAWWMDPVYLGHYPEAGLRQFEGLMPPIRPDDMQTIHQPLDFFGINIYQGTFVEAASGEPAGKEVALPIGRGLTTYGWSITPSALYWGPRFFCERYQKPVFITENGMASMDWVALDGKVHDPQRVDFLARYLRDLARACDDGVDVRGYFHWSIMDNFEWNEGYKQRFGLIYVDYPSGRRVLKDSALWYKHVIATNGASIT
jgi:beta-glucosidase